MTLYWDRSAEDTKDKYMGNITDGADLYDFKDIKFIVQQTLSLMMRITLQMVMGTQLF